MHWTKAPFTCFCRGIFVGWVNAWCSYAILVRTKLRYFHLLNWRDFFGLNCAFPIVLPAAVTWNAAQFSFRELFLSCRRGGFFHLESGVILRLRCFLSVPLSLSVCGVFFLGWPCRNFMCKWTWSQISSSPFDQRHLMRCFFSPYALAWYFGGWSVTNVW